MVVKGKILIVDFLRHVDNLDSKVRMDKDLFQDNTAVLGFSYNSRPIELGLRHSIIGHKLLVALENLTNFLYGLKG